MKMRQESRRQKGTRGSVQRVAVAPRSAKIQDEDKPIRGLKLRTVSAFTMTFALICLAAFVAGKPPVFRAGTSRSKTETLVESRAAADRGKHRKRVEALGR
jgi:hypothetical protein